MPSLVGSTVTANYLKTAPTTNFGTRALTVIKVEIDGVYVNYANSNSLFSKSVRALQQTAEVWAVFTPIDTSTDYFHAIIASDTQWSGDSANQGLGGVADNAGYGILETAIAAGNGGTAATVSVPTGFVVPFYRADTSL
jgi:hypothetical protein